MKEKVLEFSNYAEAMKYVENNLSNVLHVRQYRDATYVYLKKEEEVPLRINGRFEKILI